jgi:hypothetical protein
MCHSQEGLRAAWQASRYEEFGGFSARAFFSGRVVPCRASWKKHGGVSELTRNRKLKTKELAQVREI